MIDGWAHPQPDFNQSIERSVFERLRTISRAAIILPVGVKVCLKATGWRCHSSHRRARGLSAVEPYESRIREDQNDAGVVDRDGHGDRDGL